MSEERIEHQAGDDDAQAVDTFPDVMTVKQLAAYLQVGERSVYNLAKAGDLPGSSLRTNGDSIARRSSDGSPCSRARV